MKSKRSFAAILCAVTLLTGCSGASESSGGMSSEQSSLVSVPSYSEDNSSSTELSSSETESSSFSSSSETSSMQSTINTSSTDSEDMNDPRTFWLYPEVDGDDSTIFSFNCESNGSEIPFSSYNKMVIYESSNSKEVGTVAAEKKIDPNDLSHLNHMLPVPKSPSTKYYRMQLEGENIKSQFSNVVEIKGLGSGSGSSSVPRYTHTFTAPSYLTVIPDYSEALAEIERGVEPDSFSISVQFTCPGCGKSRKIAVLMAEFPYSRDGKMPFNVNCLMGNCPYNKSKNTLRTTIESHAVRIS